MFEQFAPLRRHLAGSLLSFCWLVAGSTGTPAADKLVIAEGAHVITQARAATTPNPTRFTASSSRM